MTIGIYQILNKVTEWKYVGSSVHVEVRWQEHLKGLRLGKHHCRHLQQAWNKYGEEAFVFTILEECAPEKLIEREQSYLPEERTAESLKKGKYYNLRPVADNSLGVRFSPETKRKISEAAKGRKPSEETRRKMSQSRMGNQYTKGMKLPPRSEETRRKIAESKRGKKRSEETRKKLAESKWGSKLSEETKEKMSKAQKGRKQSEELIRKRAFGLKLFHMRQRVAAYIANVYYERYAAGQLRGITIKPSCEQ